MQADFTCEANKSAVRLLELSGSCVVRNFYGSIRAQPTAALRKLTVQADRTEVTISAPQPEQFAYQLSVQQGSLLVPTSLAATKKGSASHPTYSSGPGGAGRPVVRASTSYAPLTLQTQPLTAQL